MLSEDLFEEVIVQMKSEESEKKIIEKSRERGVSGGEDEACEGLEKRNPFVYVGNRK